MQKYCEAIFQTKRRKTREVLVGSLGIGGDNPVRIQSMTTSNTRDVEATVEQAMRLADAGCEIVRMTVQGMKEADACEAIKNGLLKKGYTIPLVADIHFFPPAALRVVDFVEKVRINPGNFVDKRASFKTIEYDDASYAKEIDKIREKFSPLVEKCKQLKRAMRIGTNHGSLSDRIMNRYGDTPQGMVESAVEYAKICRELDYHNLVFSMKSSNPQVMILAYRLLVAEMNELGWDYPLHLGVTEAGEGEDGRIKSAMGIGSLLLDGLGDTIRVSLTEDAWNEIDPCKRLIHFYQEYENTGIEPFIESTRHFAHLQKREIKRPSSISLHRDGTVLVRVSKNDLENPELYQNLGCDIQLGLPKLKRSSADGLVVSKEMNARTAVIQQLQKIGMTTFTEEVSAQEESLSILSLRQAQSFNQQQLRINQFSLNPSSMNLIVKISDEPSHEWDIIEKLNPSVIFLAPAKNRLHYARRFFEWLKTKALPIPVILNFRYTCEKEDVVIRAAAELGSLLCDGLGDGIWIEGPYEINFIRQLSFNILQAARLRTSKTDFISCPSCGRTLFDLQDVSRRIRSRTSHLPGVKIAIMGCIVNGPGEMADADFGYVGSKPGMIDLYVGKECVEKDISFADADDRLIELIKKHGRWVEPEKAVDYSLSQSEH